MKTYPILKESDFDQFVVKTKLYFYEQNKLGKFPKMNIICKRYRKSKTPKQHRLYFACIHELKKAFLEQGYRFNEEQLHYLMKKQSGFTKMIEMPDGKMEMVVKSIADDSEDVDVISIGHLIDFVVEYAQENLNYTIDLEI